MKIVENVCMVLYLIVTVLAIFGVIFNWEFSPRVINLAIAVLYIHLAVDMRGGK